MSRADRNTGLVIKGLDLAKVVSVQRAASAEEQPVTIIADEVLFEGFVESMYEAISYQWTTYNRPAELPVSIESFRRYAYTAVKTRVARVNNERFHLRCNDAWVLPSPLADCLAGVGQVRLERPVMTIVPKWNVAHNDKLMTREEFERFGRHMRIVEKDINSKFVFVSALASDRSGNDVLMSLVPLRNPDGTLRELASTQDVNPAAAIMYLALGMDNFQGVELALIPAMLRNWQSLDVTGLPPYVYQFGETAVA